MTYRLRDAIRRADCSLAGAIFLSLATAAAVAAYAPAQFSAGYAPSHFASAAPPPKLRADILEAPALVEPAAAPEVVPVPRPKTFLSRLRIDVALSNLASETSCLAEAIYYEARGEGLLGEKAIAEVVVRRTHKAGYPHSICGVVHQGSGMACQFSFACDGTMERPKSAGEWSRAVHLAAKIVTGALPLTNITDGAIAFHAATVDLDWPGMVRTVQIGNQVFYRRPGRANPS
jgi:Cell Wall Hydrolase